MSVMGFQKKNLDGEWVGGVSSIQVFFLDFWNFFNFAKTLDQVSVNHKDIASEGGNDILGKIGKESRYNETRGCMERMQINLVDNGGKLNQYERIA